jgi:hypothetical protein
MPFVPLPLPDRLWAKVDKTGPCWLWMGSCDRGGYGQIKDKNAGLRCHRVSWELHYGPIPKDVCVLHKCDTPTCVRPCHLFLGTSGDNNRDRASKGRTRTTMTMGTMDRAGIKNGRAKLTPTQVQEIRRRCASGEPQSAVATEFGVVQSHISRIVRRVAW